MAELIILFVAIMAALFTMFFAGEKLLREKAPKLDRVVGIVQTITGIAVIISILCSGVWLAQISFTFAGIIMVVLPFAVVLKYSNIWWRVAMIVSLGMFISLYYITGDFYIFMTVALGACAILIARAVIVLRKKKQH
ncbi:MAG: hypothetical protein IJZ59_00985 [Alphaproteobacteria bacterium]|nr:hypothetical protein [Alphaproteobacteria bacterium]